jgi:hypothetical protein
VNYSFIWVQMQLFWYCAGNTCPFAVRFEPGSFLFRGNLQYSTSFVSFSSARVFLLSRMEPVVGKLYTYLYCVIIFQTRVNSRRHLQHVYSAYELYEIRIATFWQAAWERAGGWDWLVTEAKRRKVTCSCGHVKEWSYIILPHTVLCPVYRYAFVFVRTAFTSTFSDRQYVIKYC